MISSSYLRAGGLPESIAAKGHEVDAVKAAAGEVQKEIITTADVRVGITNTLDSVDALDILVIPGPAPTYVPSAETIAFIQKQAVTVTVLIICSGIFPAAFSGILSNKSATAPLGFPPILRKKTPDVDWIAKRWTTDYDDEKKKIWTSGGVTNGTDMIAAYLRENFDQHLVKIVCAIADVGDRGQEYPGVSEWQLDPKALDLFTQAPTPEDT